MAKKLAFDRAFFSVIILLVILGLVMVYSASAAIARQGGSAVNPFLVKQAVSASLGLALMLVVMHLDYRWLRRPEVVYASLLGVVALLVAVLFAPRLNDTHRWLFFGGVSLQPSELAKLAIIPFLAYHLEKKADRVNQREVLIPAIAGTGLVAALIVLEPHLSAALLVTAIAGLMLFLAGLAWRFLVLGAAILGPLLAIAVAAAPYRRERLLTFLDPERDPLGSGFQAVQSLIAVGSGGIFGQGLGHGAQKLYFLPYPHTDYIYSIVAEELGLLGAAGIVVLFAILGWRGAQAGLRAPDLFGRYLAWGFSGILLFQALLHCSVALALFPPTGVPMPFVTYGGSALVTSLLAAGVVLNVSQHA